MTESSFGVYENDIFGNRTWKDFGVSSVVRYAWDDVNRMDRMADESTGAAYKYRADGMRIQKAEGLTIAYIEDEESKSGYYDEIWSTNQPTTRYFHDGQMPVEEDFTREVDESIVTDVTRYGIGARGIDLIAKDPYNAAESVYFPIYDGHGNNVALLSRDGTGFQVTNRRAYDAWGNIRQGATTGEPKQRYCANLGHVQDDESGLTYMRARYYEPWTGRFVSEDPSMDGYNWYRYCENDPVNRADANGKEWFQIDDFLFRLDFNPNTGKYDLHIFDKKGNLMGAFWSDGTLKHAGSGITNKLLKAIEKAAKFGGQSVKGFLGKLKRIGGFGLGAALDSIKIAVVAYTSVDAFAQLFPEEFFDLMAIIMSFGQYSGE